MTSPLDTQPASQHDAPDNSSQSNTFASALRQATLGLVLLGGIGAGIGIDRLVLDASPNGSALEDADSFDVLTETFDVIRDRYVMSGEITDEELMHGAALGMVGALGDTNHSRFLDPEDAQQFMNSTRGELIGIGVNIDVSEVPLRVIMPIKGSPAYDAGVKPGDLILAIDGVDVSEMSDPQEAVALIRGETGTEVTLLVQRQGSGERAELTMTRSTVVIDPVSWAMLPGNVLWIRIDQFSKGTTDGLQTALQAGLDAGAQGLVLDLRANPGGLVLEAMGVGGLLQPKGSVLFQQKSADGDIEEIVTSDRGDRWTDRPIVVLIDGDSASAAEIVASSLSENGRATLIGETTSGTGTVLLPVTLEDGSIVLIGTELWLTPTGQVIWHNGVTPALSVTNPPEVQIAVPFLFDDMTISGSVLEDTGDQQLLAAHREMLGIIQAEDGTPQASPVALHATPIATPVASPAPAVSAPKAAAPD